MPTPPDDDLLDALMLQLGEALQDSTVDLEHTRDAIEDGLREALKDLDATPASERPPTMRVLQGGLHAGRAGAELRAGDRIDDQDLPSLDADDASEAPTRTDRRTTRRVVRTAGVHNLVRRGAVRLTGPNDWQTVYRGPQPATYRLFASRGILEVSLDGELVEQISPGRSTDVCGSVIRLRSTTEAAGVYIRLTV